MTEEKTNGKIACDLCNMSIRQIAKSIKVSPATIHNIKSGKQKDLYLSTYKKIINLAGYSIKLEKKEE